MILTCSNCQTQFSVSNAVLGVKGRKVKCSRCAHQWFQAPEGAEAPPAGAEIPQTAAPQEQPAAAAEPEVAPKHRVPVVIPEAPPSPALKLAAIALWIVAAISSVFALMPIISQHGGGKVAAGFGLADSKPYVFRDMQFKTTPQADGKMVIALSGKVQNISAKEVRTPAITIALYDQHQRLINTLVFDKFTSSVIPANGEVSFQPKINNIPVSMHEVVLDLGNNLERTLR